MTDSTVSRNTANSPASITGAASAGGGIYAATVSMSHCSLDHNSAAGPLHAAPVAGGLYVTGDTSIVSDCTFSANSTGHNTGGVFNGGTLTLTRCNFSDNLGVFSAGGVRNVGTLTVADCAFTGNSTFPPPTTGSGSGISNEGTLTVTGSTFTANRAGYYGGALFNSGNATLTNCTIAGNGSYSTTTYLALGSGAYNANGTLTLTSCTVVGNTSDGFYAAGGTILLRNTVVAGNTRSSMPSDIVLNGGTVAAASSYNLIGTGGSGGLVNGVNHNQVGVANPGLGILGSYGGPTQTIPLLASSPALNAGDPAQLGSAD